MLDNLGVVGDILAFPFLAIHELLIFLFGWLF